ncbi:histidine phosphatase family protein [Lichenifustis flavocetrariae]|uniref:Histidine phosphatase family protein n=1 Tax=Lichenifustis flavocetrariae TaxID=2949735 RepID=A0AA41YZS4_9HYPH|nr:histidine phosphatase family protein [Lichenifustis flavocetrariae]MCW6510123.1 histidine phosphatase family protein [Lichenifustis flavocetrariae]
MEPPVDFFLIRHGETDWNRQGRLQGQRDVPLNPIGLEQASAAGRKLKKLLHKEGIDPAGLRFVASPLRRTCDTMERLRSALGLPPAAYETDDRLKEIGFGAWEGLTWSEAKAVAPALVKERKRAKWIFVPPGGESYADLADRLMPWLGERRPGDVVVAHGGVARALMHILAGVPITEAPDIEIFQGRVLRFARGRFQWF